MVDDVSITMGDAAQLEIRGVPFAAVEPYSSNNNGLAGLVSRIEAVDVVPMTYPEQRFLRVQSRCSPSTVWLEVGARAAYNEQRLP